MIQRSSARGARAFSVLALAALSSACFPGAGQDSCVDALPTSDATAALADDAASLASLATLSDDGRFAVAYSTPNQDAHALVWEPAKSVWSDRIVSAAAPGGAFSAAVLAPSFDGRFVAFQFSSAGGAFGMHAFSEQADGAFSAAQVVPGITRYARGVHAAAPALGKEVFATGDFTLPDYYAMVSERAKGGSFAQAQAVHLAAESANPLAIGYLPAGGLWLISATNAQLLLHERTGATWEGSPLLSLPSGTFNVRVSRPSGGADPRVIVSWMVETEDSTGTFGDAWAAVVHLASGTVDRPVQVIAHMQIHASNALTLTTAFTPDGTKAIFAAHDQQERHLWLGTLSGANASVPQIYRRELALASPPDLAFTRCGTPVIAYDSRDAATSGPGRRHVYVEALKPSDVPGL